MSKQLSLVIILLFVCLALIGCADMGQGDTDDALANELQNEAGAVNAGETASEATDSRSATEAVVADTLVQLLDPLDEPEYYCIDVPGFRQSLNLDGALTAHTCKPNADDEMFTFNYPAVGQFYMPAYERCMEARSAEASAELSMAECTDSPLQQFSYYDDGSIQLKGNAAIPFCIAVADQAGEPTGGPSHLRRDLMLSPCADVSTTLSQWDLPGPTVP